MVFAVGVLRTYLPPQRIRKWLSGKKMGYGNVLAALLGSITPFCSCSSIPMFISFAEAGIPLGVNFSFLITSPLINEYVVVVMLGFFGWKITALYVLSGLLIGIFSGMLLGKMGLEKYLEKDLAGNLRVKAYRLFRQRLLFGWDEAVSITGRIWLWVVAGVGIGAVIHGFVPETLIQSIISKGGLLTVPAAVLLGIPLYANCAAVVPVAVVLFEKGIPLGTALAFMMATAALSLPEAVILKRVMKIKLIIIFFGIVGLAIIFTGYMFNYLFSFL